MEGANHSSSLEVIKEEKSSEIMDGAGNLKMEITENDLQPGENGTVEGACIVGSGDFRGVDLEEGLSAITSKSGTRQLDERKSSSSDMFSEVSVEYSVQPIRFSTESKDSVKTANKESSLKDTTDQSAEASPMSATKSAISCGSPILPGTGTYLVEQGKQSVSMRNSDGYNWRKYGQKQVKSPEGSRSYYRCTYSNCQAKKIECSHQSNHAIETVYRSEHNHDPPQKLNCPRETRPALPIMPANGIEDPVKPSIDPTRSSLPIDQKLECKEEESCGSDETTETYTNEEHVEGTEHRRRQKKSSSREVTSLPKPGKKPKFVVHAADDVGISGDGYRWRKYGQKMVKGNPHPRNYYRCTSAGCPVRKHIERAMDATTAMVITYKGVHDHGMPVPRRRNSPKSATADPRDNQTEWSVDKEGANTGGEKSLESTRTLLSIGFEIKPG